MTQREELEEWADEWINGNRKDVVRNIKLRGRSVLVGFVRVLIEKCGPTIATSEMRTLEIVLSDMED